MFELETISETLCGGSITLKVRVLFASRCVDPHCIDTKFRLYCLPENPSANPGANTQCERRPNTTDSALTQRRKDSPPEKSQLLRLSAAGSGLCGAIRFLGHLQLRARLFYGAHDLGAGLESS